jgi:hypothetical protein
MDAIQCDATRCQFKRDLCVQLIGLGKIPQVKQIASACKPKQRFEILYLVYLSLVEKCKFTEDLLKSVQAMLYSPYGLKYYQGIWVEINYKCQRPKYLDISVIDRQREEDRKIIKTLSKSLKEECKALNRKKKALEKKGEFFCETEQEQLKEKSEYLVRIDNVSREI